MDVVSLLLVVVVGAGLIWLALRIEPHWVSGDGQRFICRGQPLDDRGNTHGRWAEYRLRVTADGRLAGTRRSMLAGDADIWRVMARSADAPARKAVYLLQDPTDEQRLLAIRLPARSRALETLDRLLET